MLQKRGIGGGLCYFSFSVSHVIINSYTMYTNISLGDLIYSFG